MTKQLNRFQNPKRESEMLMQANKFEDVFLETSSSIHFNQVSPKATNFKGRRLRSRSIVDSLLFEIYDKLNFGRRFSEDSDANYTEHSTVSETNNFSSFQQIYIMDNNQPSLVPDRYTMGNRFKKTALDSKSFLELEQIIAQHKKNVNQVASELLRQLKRRDKWIHKRDRNYDVITAILQASSLKRSEDTRMRFSIEPTSGDSGFAQWHDAMRMVARLPGGIPYEFRKRLWLTMATKHIQYQKIDWEKVKRFCFNDRSNPDDNELGVQIVKDLHRTGCSLFCGVDAEHNQALLKRVLLAYARWNKLVGYCQGFNMLAALILEVVEWKEEDALKVMIYLIEKVLPESYFANNLRGLSVDMAVFRDLLRIRLPLLSRHLDYLQMEARDSTSGTIYEPPLTNVFTMQWFLTIFSNCLPKDSVLRVWDLMFLEGNEVLLRTALAIWDGLAYRIMTVESADEFYSIMGVLTRETLEFGIMDANHLVKMICTIAPFPFPQLAELRDKYTYNITPFTTAAVAMGAAKKGFRLFYSDDEDDEEDQLAVAAWCFATVFPHQLSPITNKAEGISSRSPSPSSSGQNITSIGPGAYGSNSLHIMDTCTKSPYETEKRSLDISLLKKQYAKIRERQKQAHVILKAATMRQHNNATKNPTAKPHSLVMNHLLLGKKPLITRKGRSSIGSTSSQHSSTSTYKPLAFKFKPMSNQSSKNSEKYNSAADKLNKAVEFEKYRRHSLPTISTGETLHWKDTKKSIKSSHMLNKDNEKPVRQCRDDSSSSTSTELCDEDAGKLTDFGSDLENEEDDAPVKSRFTLDLKSTDTETKDNVHLPAGNIPKVIVTPENPHNKWDENNGKDRSPERSQNHEIENDAKPREMETYSEILWEGGRKTDDDDAVDNDDDFSEEKREEWLAKLEMYRKTLGDLDEDNCAYQSSSDEFYSIPSDQSQTEIDEDCDGERTDDEDIATPTKENVCQNTDLEDFDFKSDDSFDMRFFDYKKKSEESDCFSNNDMQSFTCSSSLTNYSKYNSNQINLANRSPAIKSQKASYNPFPVARRSSLQGISQVGIKLGLYDPSNLASPSKKKFSSTAEKSKNNDIQNLLD